MDRIPVSRTLRRSPSDEGDSTAPVEPHLFLVIEGARPGAKGVRIALSGRDSITIGRGPERKVSVDGRDVDLRVPDPEMSKSHARIARLMGQFVVEDLGSTNGTKLGGERVTRQTFVPEGVPLEIGGSLFVLESHETEEGTAPLVDGASGVATLSPEYAASLEQLRRVAKTMLPVLLRGESGTGKEVLARWVHEESTRSGAFVPVNCGALPDTLVESQLFGHQKGAFSGAVRDEPGFVRSSDRGSLFLDEIGDLPKTSQAALLRVLQESEVTSVGATRAVKVDLRVISATHRSIEQSADFRADLYARISGYTHVLPPLRERKHDLGMLVADLLADLEPERANRLRISPAAMMALFAYDWPLNVRELRHALAAALVFAKDEIELGHLPAAMREAKPRSVETPSAPPKARDLSPDEEKLKADLVAALEKYAGNVSEISRAFGKTRMQIHRWMKRFDLDPGSFRS